MDLKCGSIWVSAKSLNSNVKVPDLVATRFGVASKLNLSKREFCCLVVRSKEQITPLESSEVVNGVQEVESMDFQRELSLLPKPLSANDLRPCHDDGTNVRVAYQGIPGAYSEAAALKVYPNCETVPCDQFESTFQAVEHWVVDKAVLPIETSLGGSIHRNYDLLLRHRLHIVGEVQMALDYCLLGLPGVGKAELKRVYSHPLALAQCDMTINKLGLHSFTADDTAGAAQMVARSGKRDTAAIASSRAAAIYGLDILADKIQDSSENMSRFLILAREPIIPGTDRRFKTSVVFALEGGPGMLVKALAAFSLREISLSKVESRPKRKNPLRVIDDPKNGRSKEFDYLFFIDFEASMAEPRSQYALANLMEIATFLRVLGSYPISMA